MGLGSDLRSQEFSNHARRGNSKDTRKWCKGRVGIEHDPRWVDFHEAKTGRTDFRSKWELQICANCGKHLKLRQRPTSCNGSAGSSVPANGASGCQDASPEAKQKGKEK